jgi:hypothetical protein
LSWKSDLFCTPGSHWGPPATIPSKKEQSHCDYHNHPINPIASNLEEFIMLAIILIAAPILFIYAALNKVSDWGNRRIQRQARLGRSVESFFIALGILIALLIWACA